MLVCSPVWAWVDCDSDDDRINTGTLSTSIGPGSTFSMYVLVRNAEDRIFSLGGTSAGYLVQIRATNTFIQTAAGDSSINYTDMDAGVHFVILVKNGNTTRAYIDNVDSGSVTANAGLRTANLAVICARVENNGYSFYGGSEIGEVAIWNDYALSLEEIEQLSNSKVKRMPLQISPANLLLYWPLDEQPDGTSWDADVAVDLSPNGNNGTGVDGANNTGLTAVAETVLSYTP